MLPGKGLAYTNPNPWDAPSALIRLTAVLGSPGHVAAVLGFGLLAQNENYSISMEIKNHDCLNREQWAAPLQGVLYESGEGSDFSVAMRYHVTCVLVQAAVGPQSLRTEILNCPGGKGHMIRNHLWKVAQTGGHFLSLPTTLQDHLFSALWYAEPWKKSGLRRCGHPHLPGYW